MMINFMEHGLNPFVDPFVVTNGAAGVA